MTKKLPEEEKRKRQEERKKLKDVNDIQKEMDGKTGKKKIIKKEELNIQIEVKEKKEQPKYNPVFKILRHDDNVITNIIHIADIHIKRNTFLERYNIVFNHFYDELAQIKEKNPNTMVCLCGDLFDQKDDLKTYSFDHTVRFLKSVSNILPLVIISGNHDTIEYNNEKIDPIGTILNHLNLKNVYHLKDSGVYVYNNIIFGVSSIFDKYIMTCEELTKIYNDTVIDKRYNEEDVKKIGLYHGQLKCSDLWFNSGHTKTIEEYGNYDYILLGDIHKFLYLNNKKTIAYSSSMISQTISETDEYHGYLEWDIMKGESQYHILKNDYGHHEIDIRKLINEEELNKYINDKKVVKPELMLSDELIIKELDKYRSGYLVINYDETLCDGVNLETLKTQINKRYPEIAVSQRYTNVQQELNKNPIEIKELQKTDNGDIINETQMNNLMIEYMKENYSGYSEEVINNILTLLKNILLETKSDKTIDYVKSGWKILYLRFDYMYGYGRDNVFDFTIYQPKNIIGIFGANAIGKSSIIDIITFMLYSRQARDVEKALPKDIINMNVNDSYGELLIQSHNTIYLIEKKNYRRNEKSGFGIKMLAKLYELTDDEKYKDIYKYHGKIYHKKDLTDENRKEVDKILVPIIGTYDNFITTSILLQGNQRTFKSLPNVTKKKFLSQILKIDHFEKANTAIYDKYKNIHAKYELLKKSHQKLKLSSDFDDEIKNIELNIEDMTEKLLNSEVQIESNNKQITELDSQRHPIDKNIKIQNDDDMDKQQQKVNSLDEDILNKQHQITVLNDDVNKITGQIEELNLIKLTTQINDRYNEDLKLRKKKETELRSKMEDLIKQLRPNDSDIRIKNEDDLINANTEILRLCESNNKNKLNIGQLNDAIKDIGQKINDLKLIPNACEIIEEYNKFLLSQNIEKTKLSHKIDELFDRKQLLQHTKIDKKISIQEQKKMLERKERMLLETNDKIIKHNEAIKNNNELINGLMYINIIDDVKEKNRLYHEEIDKKILSNIDMLLKKHSERQNHQIIQINDKRTIGQLKLELEDKISSLAVMNESLNYMNKLDGIKHKIEQSYNDLMTSKTDYIIDSLNKLKNSEYDKETFDDLITNVIETFELVLNKSSDKHIIVKKYESLQNQLQIRENKILERNILVHDIDIINNIIKDIETNNNTSQKLKSLDDEILQISDEQNHLRTLGDIEEVNMLNVELDKNAKYNKENDNNKLQILQLELSNNRIMDEVKQIKNNIESIKNNDNITNQRKEIDDQVVILRSKLNDIEITNSDIIQTYNNLCLEQDKKHEYDELIMTNRQNIFMIENKIKNNNDEIIKNTMDIQTYNRSLGLILSNNEINKQINILRNKIDYLEKNTSLMQLIYDVLQEQINDDKEYNRMISVNKQKIIELNNDIDKLGNTISQIKYDIQLYEHQQNNIDHNNQLNEQINDIKTQSTKINQQIKDFDTKIVTNNIMLSKIQDTIKINNEIHDEYILVQQEHDTYKILNELSGDNGLQLYLVKRYLDLINRKITLLLKGLIDKDIKLVIENESIYINVSLNSNKIKIFTTSGMENLMIDLALKIIFVQVSVIPTCNTLFIDESVSVLDKERIDCIDNLFEFLKQYYYNVFLITHLDTVKHNISNSLEIRKDGVYSLLSNVDDVFDLRIADPIFDVNDDDIIQTAKVKTTKRIKK